MVASAQRRHAALLMLTDGRSPILEVAREITRVCRVAGLDAAIIGGVAVFLHGYERTTTDVDAWCADRRAVADALTAEGFTWDEANREFVKDGIPIHLMTAEELNHTPAFFEDRSDIHVVSLAELLTLKLKTGVHEMKRAKDLADIVELISARGIDGSYSSQIAKDVRPDFRRIMRKLR